MRTNRFLSLLPILMAVLLASGCAKSDDSKGQADNASVSSVEDSLAKTEPVPIPEGGWTEETILDVTYINGKPLKLPCAFDDLGEGFEYVPDKEADGRMQKFGFAAYDLTYNGDWVGAVGFGNGGNGGKEVLTLSFDSRFVEDYPVIPISVNGITMGSPVSDFEKYVAKDESPDDTTGDSGLHSNSGQYEHLYYDFVKTDNKVTAICFYYIYEKNKQIDQKDNN